MISGGRKGAPFFCLKESILRKHKCTISSPFSVKVIRTYDFGACKGEASHCLSENSVLACYLRIISGPFFGLNLQKYIISGGPL